MIRPGTIHDSEGMAQLSAQFGYPSTKEQTQKRIREILDLNNNCIFVKVMDGKLIAWVQGFYSPRVESEGFVEIAGLVVDEAHRGKGIGKKLIDEVMEWSANYGCETIRVRTNVIRKETHIFYTKAGFTEVKEQKVFSRKIS